LALILERSARDAVEGLVMKAKFVGEEVEVRFEKRPGPPSVVVWRGVEYKVVSVESAQTFLDFQKSWWRRRHRDSYTVKTDSGQTMRLYFYHSRGRQSWVLHEILP